MPTPDAPPLRGLSHLSLSVTDLERSTAFYRDVLGLSVLAETFSGTAFEGRQVLLLAGRQVLALQEHADRTGEAFDPRRTGLDHLALAVGSAEELTAWAERLDALGVARSPVRDIGYGLLVELRDPDGVQLELFSPAGA